MGQATLYLFGPPRLEVNEQPVGLSLRKAYALLAYLAVTRQPHSRDLLATLLWPEANQRTARTNLRRMIYDIGRRIDIDLLTTTTETIALNSAIDLWIDIHMFTQHVATKQGNPPQVQSLLDAAAIYTDDFMAGFNLDDCPEFDEWQFFRREELRQQLAQVLIQLTDLYENTEQYKEALPHARRWLALDLLHEPAHRRLMTLYALAGQQAAAIRQYDECIRILAEELGVPPEEATTALFEAIRLRRFPATQGKTRNRIAQPVPDPQHPQQTVQITNNSQQATENVQQHASTAQRPNQNLPTLPTPFVGREQEIAEIVERLADPACRLLTLIGPGGIGKTRLAIEVARSAVEASSLATALFRDGCYFVPLQPVSDVANIAAAIADVLDLHLYDNRSSQEQLLDYLAGKELLLVLDNFEHLLDGIELISTIQQTSHTVKFLVTSRDALRLQEAWFHPVTGMYFPTTGEDPNTATYDAMRLFAQCAQRTQVGFSIGAEQTHVMRICQLVDGMPLALELAAAWLKVLSVEEVAQEIERGLDILIAQHKNIPERHRSIRAVFLQSWEQLSEEEREVLMKLSVFHGGFDKAAAQAVAGATLLALASLVDGALLQRVNGDRYQLHELLRQFAAEALAENSQREHQTLARFSDYYLDLLSVHGKELNGPKQQSALNVISLDLDNIRASWHWSCAEQNVDAVSRVADPLYTFHQVRSRYQEGQELLLEAIRTLQIIIGTTNKGATDVEQPEEVLHQLRARWSALGTSLGSYEEPKAILQQCLARIQQQNPQLATTNLPYKESLLIQVERGTDTQREMAFCYEFLGETARCQGEQLEALAHFEQCLTLGKMLGDEEITASAQFNLGNVLTLEGCYPESAETLKKSLLLYRKIGRPDRTAHVLDKLGYTTYNLGKYDEAEQYYRESLAIFRQIGDRFGIAAAQGGLAIPMISVPERRRLHEALPLIEEVVALCRETGRSEHLSLMLISRGEIYTLQGEYAQAKKDFREALILAQKIEYPIGEAECYVYLGRLALCQSEFLTAKANLSRGVQIAMAIRFFKYAIYALIDLAQLLLQLKETPPEERDGIEINTTDFILALESLLIAQNHPATHQRSQREIAEYIPQIEVQLSQQICAEVQVRAQQRTLDEIAQEHLRTVV